MEARKIIITGGATRIGAAIAKKLSGPNIEIVIHFNKSKSKAESLKKELEKNGSKIYLVKGDLSKETDVNKILKKHIKKYFSKKPVICDFAVSSGQSTLELFSDLNKEKTRIKIIGSKYSCISGQSNKDNRKKYAK